MIGGLAPAGHVDERPSYNIAPSQSILLARNTRNEGREWTRLEWGLLPYWAKEPKMRKPINARSETVEVKPSFREAFKYRRCLIAADGYYEWQQTPSGKQPFYITLKQEHPFCFAGLWERWKPSHGEPIETCCILTTDANAYTVKIHDRMPVIVHPKHYELWLDQDIQDRNPLEAILQPYPWMENMTVWPVSRYVNKPENDDERCLEAVQVG